MGGELVAYHTQPKSIGLNPMLFVLVCLLYCTGVDHKPGLTQHAFSGLEVLKSRWAG